MASIMAKSRVGRRGFLKGAATGVAAGAAAAVAPSVAIAQQSEQASRPAAQPLSKAAETAPPANLEVLTADRPGSDFMVEVIKSLHLDYMCANPGSSFRSLHESLVNYGGNTSPELITCCHEESSVAMAHGYAKV